MFRVAVSWGNTIAPPPVATSQHYHRSWSMTLPLHSTHQGPGWGVGGGRETQLKLRQAALPSPAGAPGRARPIFPPVTITVACLRLPSSGCWHLPVPTFYSRLSQSLSLSPAPRPAVTGSAIMEHGMGTGCGGLISACACICMLRLLPRPTFGKDAACCLEAQLERACGAMQPTTVPTWRAFCAAKVEACQFC